MRKAVIFGAGNIGRGFIGALFSQAGFQVTFIDVAIPVVERINQDHQYPLRIVTNDGSTETMIQNVYAVNGNDKEAAVQAIVDADITATCVGAKAIKFIIPNFVAGVKARMAAKRPPLNLLICENLMDADEYVRSLLEPVLTAEEMEYVGLVETSVGRMVPTPKPEDNTDQPLRVSTEPYGVLPVDKAAFKGEVPVIKNIIPFTPFHFYIERKLHIHNMGHAISAYLGDYLGYEFIYQSISDMRVRVAVQNAMQESALALSGKYTVDAASLSAHVNDLVRRFANVALGDSCARVGADIPRKLARADRLIGAAESVLAQGGQPIYISLGAAAALYDYCRQNALPTDTNTALKTLLELSALPADSPVVSYIMELFPAFAAKKSLEEIIQKADSLAIRVCGATV